jgi:hypothetical protein
MGQYATDPVTAFIDMLDGVQKVNAVLVALEDRLLFITPGYNVIDSASILYT